MTLAARLARIRERARARNREVTRVASAATHRDRGDPKAGAGPRRRAQTAMQPSAAQPARLAKASDRVTRAEQQVLLRLMAQIRSASLRLRTSQRFACAHREAVYSRCVRP